MLKGNREKKKSKENYQNLNSLQGNIDNFWKKYSTQTAVHVKLIDVLILQLLTIIGIQYFYRLVIGDDFPKNAFLSGIMCPLGVIMLLVSIRTEEKNYRALGEFLLAVLVLFMVSINFIG